MHDQHEPNTPPIGRTLEEPASRPSISYADMSRCQVCSDPAADVEFRVGQFKQQHIWPGHLGRRDRPYDHTAQFGDPSQAPALAWPVAMIAQRDGHDPLPAELWEDPTQDTVVQVVYCHTRRSARVAVSRILGPAPGRTSTNAEPARAGQVVLVDQYGGGRPPRRAEIVQDAPTSAVVQVKYVDNGRTAGIARRRILGADTAPPAATPDAANPLAAVRAKPAKNSLTGHGNPATGVYFGTGPEPKPTGRRVRLSRPSMAVLITDADSGERVEQFGTTRKFWLAPDIAPQEVPPPAPGPQPTGEGVDVDASTGRFTTGPSGVSAVDTGPKGDGC